jgi:hypothetical protein
MGQGSSADCQVGILGVAGLSDLSERNSGGCRAEKADLSLCTPYHLGRVDDYLAIVIEPQPEMLVK